MLSTQSKEGQGSPINCLFFKLRKTSAGYEELGSLHHLVELPNITNIDFYSKYCSSWNISNL